MCVNMIQSRSLFNDLHKAINLQDICKLVAFSVLEATVKKSLYVSYFKKHATLPNLLPNEF